MSKLKFADKAKPEVKVSSHHTPWLVLVVDDDPEVHTVTELALRGIAFLDRPIQFLHAHSGAEAAEVLARCPDVALILLDVVMETDDAGLRFVQHVRGALNNKKVRIVLRTGQPGQAPENEVILRYDVNDYKTKTELTQQKLFSTVITALRGYQDLLVIEASRQGLRKIIEASASLMQMRSLQLFAGGVLTQLGGMMGAASGGILCSRAKKDGELSVVAATGRFESALDGQALDPAVKDRLVGAMERQLTTIEADHTVLYMQTPNSRNVAVYIEAERPPDELERSLIEVFGANISVSFDNLEMFDEIVRANEVLEQRVLERTRELHEREARLSTVLEASPVGVAIVMAADGRPLFANSRIMQLLGHSSDDASPSAFLEPSLLAEVMRQGRIEDYELTVTRPDGQYNCALLSARRMTVAGDEAVLMWLYDITRRKELEHDLLRHATIDHLTGVPNRRHFIDLAEQELVRSQRYARPVCLLMLDIDHFKKINDTYGHQAGDDALRAVATASREALRTSDSIGRLGGEEFAILLPETTIDHAEATAERIRLAVARLALPQADGSLLSMSVSLGVTGIREDEPTVDIALARADKALYYAKAGGRNRAVTA
jgi:diguanylate cyclase (GGDEF)-like protein/PAS domain S-box-containing protein